MGKLNSDDEIRNSNKNVFKSLSHYKNYFKELIYSKDLTLRKILEVPTLYLFAESDSFLEIPSNKEIKKYFNDFEIRVIEGNHWIHRDRPDRVNQILDRFISKQLPKKNRNA